MFRAFLQSQRITYRFQFASNKSLNPLSSRCYSSAIEAESTQLQPKSIEPLATLPVQPPTEDLQRKLQILKLEVSVLRQDGRKVPDPDLLKQHHWDHLLNLNSKSGRSKYYAFLWKLEKKKENEEIKKDKRKLETEERKIKFVEVNSQNNHIIYSLTNTTIFLRIYETTINLWHNNKLTRAMQFGQKLVIDCSYDDYMVQREAMNTAKQLMLSFATNRVNDQPFDLHFCNANPEKGTISLLKRFIPTIGESHFPLNIHEGGYLDLFPKEKLVYLTPHCKNDLEYFDHDAIYIVGAMVDKINNEPLSLGKAKKLGLKMARLPLDRYLQWGSGSGKSLTINQMIEILLSIKNVGNWTEALKYVPQRKIFNDEFKLKKDFEKSVMKTKFNFQPPKRIVTRSSEPIINTSSKHETVKNKDFPTKKSSKYQKFV